MDILETQINTRSPEYQTNRAAMQALVDDLNTKLAQGRAGNPRGAKKMAQRGKLLPRERVERLLDPGTPFLELCPLAAYDMYNNETIGASSIAGIGIVSGVECLLTFNDPTIKGGAVYPLGLQKNLRIQEIAFANKLPMILGIESAGANLQYQSEIFVEGGRSFANQARLSAAGIPQIALVFGSSTAGGAYNVGLSDYTVLVRNQAKMFLGGPPLVKMATGELVDDETLGGAEMHTAVSGLGDYLAEDDADAIRIGRMIVAQLNERKPIATVNRRQTPEPPKYDPDELLGIIPANERIPFDIREIIARVVDGSRFFEFKRDYGPTLVTGHAHINGYPVGILGNNGVLFSECAHKAAQFIQLCNQSRTPLIYLHNITGFMVGSKYEHGGIIKHGSSMINAVANSTVPQFSVIVGGSYGAGNYAMCGRGYDPHFIWTWPNSKVAVMGGEQAAGVLAIVQAEAAKRRGVEPDQNAIKMVQMMTQQKFDQESTAYYGTARLWDDGIIDPRDTRQVLSIGLSVAHNVDFVSSGAPPYGTFRL
ncbi:MAG: methylcrotonoyl-CoA carboxylase [Chloroflexi bacterium]|nr:methylcrotonoyl-CoA carboxylase [Chloroflexota bacterium]